MELYERVKILRKEHLGLSQTAFGERLGVTRDVVNNIENNRLAKPEQKTSLVKLMCREFGVNEEWLMNGTGEMFVELTKDEQLAEFFADVQIAGENDFRNRFVSVLAELDPEDWKLVEKIVLKLSNKPRE